jgi:sigma-B regulation protein RsbQ
LDIIARNNVTLGGNTDENAPTMVFAHGFGCDQNMWRYLTPAFESQYKTVLFDYVGCGRSDIQAYDSLRYSSLDGYAQDLLDVLNALNLKNVIYVGHSVSGMIGGLASIREPMLFDHLAMVCPSPCYMNVPPDYIGGFDRADLEGLMEMMDKNYIGWANFLAPVVMKNSEQPELTGELRESFCSTDPRTARGFAMATFFADNREDLPRIVTPTLILQTSDDSIAPLEVGEYMHSTLPNNQLALARATGHCPHMSHPAETIELIASYLANSSSVGVIR